VPALLPLLDPDDDEEELRGLLPEKVHRDLYRLLYETRRAPLTMVELRQTFGKRHGDQAHLDRRLRAMRKLFNVEKRRSAGERSPRYVLTGRLDAHLEPDPGISRRVRAEVLRLGRCAMCGRSPTHHGAVLVVDHKVPRDWGGHPTAIENLQPLCEDCNAGKKAYFASLDEFGPAIAQAAAHEEVHRRLGELLLAVSPGEVRSDTLELVANLPEAQEDWHKRLRELREIGWNYKYRRQREDGRVRTYYRLTKHVPWPEGSIRAAITAAERAKKAAKKKRSS
jgi:5-methylcytosine-specific restriction endonuclease McrA